MDPIVVLKWALFGEAYVSVGLASSIMCHAVYLTWIKSRHEDQMYRAKSIMVAALDSRSLEQADYSYIASLPKPTQSKLLIDLIFNLDGSQRRWLVGLAKRTGLIGYGEANCRSRWWWRRLRGARLLTALGGGEAVVPKLLDDPSPVVRAQAAEWAIGHPDTKIVRRLIQMLGDGSGLCKFAVQDSLLQMGSSVTDPLAEYLSDPSSRQVGAAMEVAARLTDPQFLNPAISRCDDQAPETRALAANMLGALGSKEGIESLLRLLRDPVAKVRLAAAGALGNLRNVGVASPLVELLHDSAWEVRREVGLALRNLGSPGILFLRRSLSDNYAPAADMARQVLDLPDSA